MCQQPTADCVDAWMSGNIRVRPLPHPLHKLRCYVYFGSPAHYLYVVAEQFGCQRSLLLHPPPLHEQRNFTCLCSPAHSSEGTEHSGCLRSQWLLLRPHTSLMSRSSSIWCLLPLCRKVVPIYLRLMHLVPNGYSQPLILFREEEPPSRQRQHTQSSPMKQPSHLPLVHLFDQSSNEWSAFSIRMLRTDTSEPATPGHKRSTTYKRITAYKRITTHKRITAHKRSPAYSYHTSHLSCSIACLSIGGSVVVL